jgi:putative PEP-CTERM system TPR-repeat lipoprotein
MTGELLSALRRAALTGLVGTLLAVGAGAAWASDGADKARRYLESGDTNAAVIELKNALQRDPGDVDARLLLGKTYLGNKAGAEAEKELRRAAELGADPAHWRLELIDALLLQGKFSDVLDRLDGIQADTLDARDRAAVLARRGAAHLGLKQVPEAQDAYAQALALDPDNEKAALGRLMIDLADQQDPEKMLSPLAAFLAKFPANVDGLLLRAELHRRAGELDAAASDFDRILELTPNELRAVLGRVAVRIAQGRLDEAEEDLDRADEIRKGVVMTDYLRGLVAFQEKDFDAAKQHLERVVAAAPGDMRSELLLGVIAFSRNDLQIAEEYLSRVVSAAPGNLPAIKVLGATRIKLRQPGKAIEVLEPAAYQRSDAQVMALLGSAYMLDGDAEKGQDWLGRAVELAPDVAALRTQLALTMLAGGETSKAIDELQSAVDLGQDILQADVLLVLAEIKNKRFDEALSVARALEARRPQDPVAYNLTGLTYLAQDKLDEASERFDKALAVDPEFVTAELNLARVDVARSDLDAAKQRYERVLARQPAHLTALLGLSALAERRGDAEAMVAWLQKAQEANPRALAPGIALARHFIQNKEPLKAVSAATSLASQYPDNAAVLEVLARAQALAGDNSAAVRALEQLAEQRPDDGQLQYLIGGAKWKVGDLAGARNAFDKASRLDPSLVNARVAQAAVAFEDGRVGEAMEIAKQLQADHPDSPLGLQLEGDLYLKQKRPDLAIPPLEGALAMERTSAVVLALASAYVDQQQVPKAIELMEGWYAEQPNDLQVLGRLALLQQQAGRTRDAIASYERLIASDQKGSVVLNNLAWLYQEVGDERALETARQAYDLEPSRPEVADTYGWILLKSGKAGEALSILQQAYVSYPTQTEIGFHVAVALKEAGRSDEAVKLLRRLLRETPNFEQAEEAKSLLAELEQ